MMPAKIHLFDIRTNLTEEFDISTIVMKEHEYSFKELERNAGIKIEIKSITNTEQFAENFFQKHNYKTAKLRPNSYYNLDADEELIFKYLDKNFKIKQPNTGWKHFISIAGVPDYLVYRINEKGEIYELFFCEVKNQDDAVRFNQIKWFFQSDVPLKLLYAETFD